MVASGGLGGCRSWYSPEPVFPATTAARGKDPSTASRSSRDRGDWKPPLPPAAAAAPAAPPGACGRGCGDVRSIGQLPLAGSLAGRDTTGEIPGWEGHHWRDPWLGGTPLAGSLAGRDTLSRWRHPARRTAARQATWAQLGAGLSGITCASCPGQAGSAALVARGVCRPKSSMSTRRPKLCAAGASWHTRRTGALGMPQRPPGKQPARQAYASPCCRGRDLRPHRAGLPCFLGAPCRRPLWAGTRCSGTHFRRWPTAAPRPWEPPFQPRPPGVGRHAQTPQTRGCRSRTGWRGEANRSAGQAARRAIGQVRNVPRLAWAPAPGAAGAGSRLWARVPGSGAAPCSAA
jgi:hypothetical protein